MPLKMTGLDFKAFYSDPEIWSDERESYHDDAIILVDGKIFCGDNEGERFKPEGDEKAVPDTAAVVIECGAYFRDGRNPVDEDLISVARAWLKKRDTVSFVVTVPKAKADEIKAAIRTAGGKIEA